MRFSRRPVEDTGLLRMTDWVAEIATSSNQKTIRFLTMTDLDWILLNQAPSKNFNKCRSNDLLSPINRFSKN